MKLYKIGGCALVLATFSQSASSVPFSLEARSMGMGNVGVATADIATAAFANPAMLAFQRENDDFSLLIGVGGFLNDNQGLIDNVDDFQSAFDRGDLAAANNLLVELSGKVIAPELSAAVAMGFAGDTYAMAVSARSDILAVGALEPSVGPPTLSNNFLNIQGVHTTEVGFSIARNFDVGGSKLAVGLTPKIVSVEAILIREPVTSISTDLNDLLADDQVLDLGDYTTFDIGIVYGLTDSFQVGLVGKNIITEEIDFISLTGVPATLKFDSRWRAGAAYRNRFLTVGVDLDIVENDPIVASPVFSGLKTQVLSLGAEFNAFDFAQLRVGVIKNIASDIPDEAGNPFYTAGVGFWLGFNLDIAVISGEGESLGAFVQTGFRF
jgi:hypothetical protein